MKEKIKSVLLFIWYFIVTCLTATIGIFVVGVIVGIIVKTVVSGFNLIW